MTVTVAACQIPAYIDAPDPAVLVTAVREAADQGARLIVLPELAVCGYAFRNREEARAAAQPLEGPTVGLLRSLSRELGCVLVCGLAELGEDGAVYNSAVVVERGVLRTCYRKVHLWGRESQLFTAGSHPPAVIETAIGRLAVLICYDLEFPEWVGPVALAGAEILAVPANWPLVPRPAGERPLEVIKAQAAAATWRLHVVVADRCGSERGVDWIGGSAVCASTGFLVVGPPTPVDALAERVVLTGELDPAAARNKSLGPHNDAVADRRPDLYR